MYLTMTGYKLATIIVMIFQTEKMDTFIHKCTYFFEHLIFLLLICLNIWSYKGRIDLMEISFIFRFSARQYMSIHRSSTRFSCVGRFHHRQGGLGHLGIYQLGKQGRYGTCYQMIIKLRVSFAFKDCTETSCWKFV